MFGSSGKKRPDDDRPLTQPLPSGWGLAQRGLLGAGGVSRVYRMEDAALKREVALKVLRPELMDSSDAVQRFIEEARITALLDHPNVLPVHGLSAEKETACFTMKVVGGRSLQQLLEDNERDGTSDLMVGVEVLLRVCDAVAYAHSKGVLHLDLKPSNVMVGEFGQIYLVDWGVARRIKELPSRENDDGGKAGTPAYMAPEQARGENWRYDERTDVFGLGGILYRILTWQPPYRESTTELTLKAAARGFVVPPDQRSLTDRTGALNRRLITICTRALQPDPADRYQNVAEFKRELEAYVRGFGHLPRKVFRAGTVIVKEGQPGDAAYVIFEGECEATRVVGGITQRLRELGPGQMFGETAVFANSTRSATVSAVTDVVVGVVDQQSLKEDMDRTSVLSLAIRTVAAGFLDLDAQTAAALELKRKNRAFELAMRYLALYGTTGERGVRTAKWQPMLERLVKDTELDPEVIKARLLEDPGVRLHGDELVLMPP
ncbi:MAG: protein kinase [Myxococcaceae bacterium]